jgi:hypothetical protein
MKAVITVRANNGSGTYVTLLRCLVDFPAAAIGRESAQGGYPYRQTMAEQYLGGYARGGVHVELEFLPEPVGTVVDELAGPAQGATDGP